MSNKISEVVKACDMSDDLKNEVIRISKEAIEKCSTEKEIASYILENFRSS